MTASNGNNLGLGRKLDFLVVQVLVVGLVNTRAALAVQRAFLFEKR